MDSSVTGLPVPHHLPEFAQVHWISDAIQHLILCHPFLLLLHKSLASSKENTIWDRMILFLSNHNVPQEPGMQMKQEKVGCLPGHAVKCCSKQKDLTSSRRGTGPQVMCYCRKVGSVRIWCEREKYSLLKRHHWVCSETVVVCTRKISSSSRILTCIF